MHRKSIVAAVGFGLLLWAASASAQIDSLGGALGKSLQGGADPLLGSVPKVTVRGTIKPPRDQQPARLVVTAQVAEGWHIYSLAQGGALAKQKTKITLDSGKEYSGKGYRLAGPFKSESAPEIREYPDIWPGVRVEEHSGSVTWQAPLDIEPGTDLAKLEIAGAVNATACADSCIPARDYQFVATVAGSSAGKSSKTPAREVSAPAGEARARVQPAGGGFDEPASTPEASFRHGHAVIQGSIDPGAVAPGGRIRLTLTAEPQPPWYIYALADRDSGEVGVPKPTLISFKLGSPLQFGSPAPSEPPSTKLVDGQLISYYSRPVSWTIEVSVPPEMQPGDYPIEGWIGLQTCKDGSCDLPGGAQFSATIHVGTTASPAAEKIVFTPAKYALAVRGASASLPTATASAPANLSELPDVYEIDEGAQLTSLPVVLFFSFLGGLILNLMPCVLPVIGLKILSFVEQGGQARGRVLMLNLVYAAGILAVFLVLATLAVTLNLRWGEHFGSLWFNVTLCAVVFAMALSFLGVWEIPIPGFVGSGGAVQLASREGMVGAFAKGVLATVLATPCSGPYLGSVFWFTVEQPAHVTYLVFAAIGLGMASPYLLIGAFPSLIRFLPKPGAWMDTFKQFMGFILLATVVYLFSLIKRDYFIPTLALLFGIWAGCWWVGRMPYTLSRGRRLLGWLEGAACAAVVGSFAFSWLVPYDAELPWKPFSSSALVQLSRENKTVLVDFTADWCPTCQLNLRSAIDTEPVRKLIERNEVVPLLADLSDTQSEAGKEIFQMLARLKSESIPVLAIFPAGQPRRAIVLRDLISQSKVLEALQQAGPSRSTGISMTGNSKLPGNSPNPHPALSQRERDFR